MINVAYGLKISGTIIQDAVRVSGKIKTDGGFPLTGSMTSAVGTFDTYDGPYTVTPSSESQTLYTYNKRATDNITVEAIPNNYGLITWNGSYLTVS